MTHVEMLLIIDQVGIELENKGNAGDSGLIYLFYWTDRETFNLPDLIADKSLAGQHQLAIALAQADLACRIQVNGVIAIKK